MKSNQNCEPRKILAHIFPSAFAGIFLPIFSAQSVTAAPDAPALPNSIMTPGQVDPDVTAAIICAHDTKSRRRVSASVKEQALIGYNVPLDLQYKYEIDHL